MGATVGLGSAGSLKVDFGEGAKLAIDRVNRGIVFMLDGAIGRLKDLWYDRALDRISIEGLDLEDPLPVYLSVRGRRVYEIGLSKQSDDTLMIEGIWIRRPGRNWRAIIRKLMFWRK